MSQYETFSQSLVLATHKSRTASMQNSHQQRYFCGMLGLTYNELSSQIHELPSLKHVSPILPLWGISHDYGGVF